MMILQHTDTLIAYTEPIINYSCHSLVRCKPARILIDGMHNL